MSPKFKKMSKEAMMSRGWQDEHISFKKESKQKQMCNALHHKEGSGATSPVKKQRHSIHTAAQQKEQNLSETATPTLLQHQPLPLTHFSFLVGYKKSSWHRAELRSWIWHCWDVFSALKNIYQFRNLMFLGVFFPTYISCWFLWLCTL